MSTTSTMPEASAALTAMNPLRLPNSLTRPTPRNALLASTCHGGRQGVQGEVSHVAGGLRHG